MNFLSLLLVVCLASVVALFFISNWRLSKTFSLVASFLYLTIYLFLWLNFDFTAPFLQYSIFFLPFDVIPLSLHLAVDGLSVYFLFLSLLLLPVCILCAWSTVRVRVVEFQILLHVIVFLLIVVFSVQDLFLFYVAFESILIPMFLIIGVWGSRDRKVHAAYQFFLYTLIGSILMLVALLLLYTSVGSTHLFILLNSSYTESFSNFVWLALFIAFAVKVPMIPFHIWLPEAHVEAPTAGSVILAGILLKMGTYGLIKFSLPVFPESTIFFQPLICVISLVGIIYSAFTTIRQVDLKKIIAYSSVGHMNYVTLGIASTTISGLEGSLFMMLGHGFVSSALFLCVGLLYERYHTRVLLYYSGLVFGMPIFSFFFFFFTLANVSLPGTSNFVGELLILIGVFVASPISAVLSALAVILSAVYAFWLYNRTVFGHISGFLHYFSDLNRREFILLVLFSFFIMFSGIFPAVFLEAFHVPVSIILDRFY